MPWERLIILIGKIRDIIYPKRSSFDKGDLVVLKDGSGQPMLVIEVNKIKGRSERLLYCRWTEPVTKEIRYNLFHESKVRHFDWSKKY